MRALMVFSRVILALMLREAKTRHGQMHLGYIWAFIEPAIYVAAFIVFREFVGTTVPFGENGIVFMLTAVLTFRTGMSLTRRTMGAIQANIALLTFPQVKTFDVIVARIMLDAVTWTITTVMFVFGLYFLGGVLAAETPEIFIEGYAATLFFGASFGFFNATFVRLFPYWDRIMGLISLPLFFMSGVFFIPSVFPPELLNILRFNPFLHCVEWVRSGTYIDYKGLYDPLYLLSVSSCLLFTGLFINKFFQRKMIQE